MCLLKDQASSKQEKAVGALRREVERVTHELHKEKSRSEAYKSKALEAHLRSIKAKEVLDSLCNNKQNGINKLAQTTPHDGPVLFGDNI